MISATRINKYTIAMKGEKHVIISDVDASMGGDGLGSNPHEIMEAALAACTSITMQMYADRHKLDLTSADVDVVIDPSKGYENVVINRKVTLRGNLTDEQKAMIIKIADQCPIHKMLEHKVNVITSVE